MRGVFRLASTISAVTTAKTLLIISTEATTPIEILSSRITCQDEDTSEQMYAELNRISSLGPLASTTGIPKPTEEGSTAFSGIGRINVTASEPTYDNITGTIFSGGANKLAGWEYVPLPEERPIVKANDDVGLRLIDALANSSDLTAEITFREIG